MFFKQIFEEKLAQYAYLIGCQQTGEAIIIDPMRDVDQYFELANKNRLRLVAAADTHIHADYLTGLRELAEQGLKVYASDEGDEDWKYEWLKGSEYQYELLKNGDRFSIGNIIFTTHHTPGHTPEHLSYTVTDRAGADGPMGMLSGDFVFVGDLGRPDLLETAAGQKGVMESSARTLYKSVKDFKKLPEYLQVWPAHGAGSACGKALGSVPETTVGYELRFNPSILAADTEDNFVDFILEGQPEPPLYFARMKRDNREGPAVLGDLPNPEHLNPEEFIKRGSAEDAEIIDTRERSAFMGGHIPGSLLSPFNRQFNTVAGCYVEEKKNLYLVIDQEHVEEAVRDLVRIGLDGIEGYITPSELEAYHDQGFELKRIDPLDFKEVKELVAQNGKMILDVRKATEYEEGHIKDAVNICHTRLLERENELPRNKTLMVHCKSGARSAVATALLNRDGYEAVNVDDHIKNWPELVKTKGE